MSAIAEAVRERPILFGAPMVRAILDGRKTQTRRIVIPQPPRVVGSFWDLGGVFKPGLILPGWDGVLGSESHKAALAEFDAFDNECIACPYGVRGDRLWVREELRGDGQPGDRRVGIARYGADGKMVLPCCACGSVHCTCCDRGEHALIDVLWRWKRPALPSMFMPRWASRILLELTDVRVERLQDISEDDAMAEGCFDEKEHDGSLPSHIFAELWNSLNEKRGYGWDVNPWVWAIAFRRIAP